MEGWFPAVMTLAGVLLGFSITEYRYRRERKERYQVITFEKRLDAYQQAYYWCQRLTEALTPGNVEEIHKVAKEMREWWNIHCLLLDPDSRDKILELSNIAHSYADELEGGKDVWSVLQIAKKALVLGIGNEYLPETPELPEELRETM